MKQEIELKREINKKMEEKRKIVKSQNNNNRKRRRKMKEGVKQEMEQH